MLKNVYNVPATDMPQSSTDTPSPFLSKHVCGAVFSHIKSTVQKCVSEAIYMCGQNT